ncbi:ATP-binding protein [Planctomycetota bacterium]
MALKTLPAWAKEMRSMFRSGALSQFILHGNVYDSIPYEPESGKIQSCSLPDFLADVMLQQFQVVLYYSQGTGIIAKRGKESWHAFLKAFDRWNDTNYAASPGAVPKEARKALELIDRFLQWSMRQTRLDEDKKIVAAPLKAGVIIDYAAFLFPAGDPLHIGGYYAEILIKVLQWANDPGIMDSHIATFLLVENLSDLNGKLVKSPYNAKLRIDLPSDREIAEYIPALLPSGTSLEDVSEIPLSALAGRLAGLTRVNIRNMVSAALEDRKKLADDDLRQLKKSFIEKECHGLLEFIESDYNLDLIAGHDAARKWLRDDARLLAMNKHSSLPMGYLLTGRVGTGKTFLTLCWAGEIGIPCVVLKNFRDKWVGSTEANLEKIFNVLHALNNVMVFVDEADQATGTRGGSDSAVSGRIYAMLAKEMSDTRNRGKIIWVFATSRPDLLEVDLKRPGRLDVHIPLFVPQTAGEKAGLFTGIMKKLDISIPAGKIPALPENVEIGGNEMEAILVRAKRLCDLQKNGDDKNLPEILAAVIEDFQPSAYTAKMEYMDLVAVKECTDRQFLIPKYAKLSSEEINRRIEELGHT